MELHVTHFCHLLFGNLPYPEGLKFANDSHSFVRPLKQLLSLVVHYATRSMTLVFSK